MAITIEQVTKLLDDVDLSYYESRRREDLILVPFPVEDGVANVFLDLQDEGEILKFRVPQLLTASRQNKPKLMERLLGLNYHLKFIKFSMDPDDGEVSLEIDLLIGDNTVLHENQFHRCMACLTSVLYDHVRELKDIQRGIEATVEDKNTVSEDLIEQLMADSGSEDADDTGDSNQDQHEAVTDVHASGATDIDDIMQRLLGCTSLDADHGDMSNPQQTALSELKKFIDEECERDSSESAATDGSALYSAYSDWSAKNDGLCLSKRVFNNLLRELGFTPTNWNKEFLGIKLRNSSLA